VSAPVSEVRVRPGGAADLAALAPLWRALYRDQRQAGMLLAVPENGFELWAEALAPLLGRFACLFVAEADGRPVGFLAGRLRSAPPWLGGEPAGFVSEVYVDAGWRGRALGERLVEAAVGWFGDSGVARVELQVLAGNEGARRLYRRLGFVDELFQMARRERGPGGRPEGDGGA
jgi:ribosomal protein S18 acetylase RimI-like enzyme